MGWLGERPCVQVMSTAVAFRAANGEVAASVSNLSLSLFLPSARHGGRHGITVEPQDARLGGLGCIVSIAWEVKRQLALWTAAK